MTYVLLITSVALTVAVVAGIGAVWVGIRDRWFSPSARRMCQIRALRECSSPLADLIVTRAGRGEEPPPGTRLARLSLAARLDDILEQALLPWSRSQFVAVTLSCGVVAGIVCLLVRMPARFYPLAVVAPMLVPWVAILARRRRRIRKIESQLPQAFDALANAIRAGQCFVAALQAAAVATPSPLREEFQALYEALNLGVPLEDGLSRLTGRVPNRDVKLVAAALKTQQRVGADVTKVLDLGARIVRERFNLMGQIRALSAEGRLSGMVLLALPLLAFAAMYQVAPDYLSVLVKDDLGQKILMVTVALQVVGALVIRKIVNPDW